MNKREVMKVENLVRNYKMVYSDRQGEEEIKVLKGLDFTIEEQEFVGIMGKSGCGKTTLLKVLGSDRQTDFRKDISLLEKMRQNYGVMNWRIYEEERLDSCFRIFIC